MDREIREVERADLQRPAPGSVAGWVRAVVGCTVIVAVALAAVSANAAWRADGLATRLDGFWFRNGLAIAIAGAIAAVFLPRARSSRFVRLAALLPAILLAGMIVAWGLWSVIAPRMPYVGRNLPLLRELPIGAAVAVMAAAACLAAAIAGPRRADAWIRTLVVVALVDLLLLGLWLPIASAWWGSRDDVWHTWRFQLGSSSELVALALGPPLVVATAFAALALHRPVVARGAARLGKLVLWPVFPAAIMARLGASEDARLVYLNLVPFLAAGAFVAAAALVALVASLWLRAGRARRRLARERAPVVGVIPDDEDDPRGLVACLELEGWLSGPRPLVDAFEVETAAGRIPIPVGAELAASVPAGSSILHPGEAVAVLRRGDRVVVGGLVGPDPDHPFRSSAALVPGPDGVVVRRHDDRSGGLDAIALLAWRPCVAFLMILTAAAIPGLVSAIVHP